MNNDCARWKDALLEAALAGESADAPELAAHLRDCGACARELSTLRERREQMDALLPVVVRGAEPSVGFAARVTAAAEAAGERKQARIWRTWVFAAATVAVVAAVLTGWSVLQRRPGPPVADGGEFASAQKLAEWRAPSDVLLATPGRAILQSTPRLGGSYLKPAAPKP